MKADDAFEFSLRPAVFVVVDGVWLGSDSAGRCRLFAVELVVPKAKAVGTLGGSIELEVFDDLETTHKVEEAP